MRSPKPWLERYEERHRDDPVYLVEKLALDVYLEIRQRKAELGVTQADLAKRLGLTQSRVSQLLRYNRNLTLRTLALLANALEAEWADMRLLPKGQPRGDEDGEWEERYELTERLIATAAVPSAEGWKRAELAERRTYEPERVANSLVAD